MTLVVPAGIYALLVAAFAAAMVRAFRARQELTVPQGRPPTGTLPAVSVIVPARDEAETIAACLLSLLEQDYPAERLQVILVDDHSRDGTRGIAEALATQDPKLQVTSAPELPPGWTGKNHACHHGAGLASGEWLCFVDADTHAEPDLLRATVDQARRTGADLFSISPFQLLESVGERLVLPAVFLGIAARRDFRRVNDPTCPDAIANGQFLLFRREAYDALGGHTCVAGEVGEDLAFADLVKGSSLRLGWGFGDALLTTRMYESMGQVWRGFSKNMAEIMEVRGGGDGLLAAARLLALGWLGPAVLAAAFLAPPEQAAAALLAGRLAATGVVTMGVIGLATLHELRVPLGYVLALPFGFTFHAALLLASLQRRRAGRREWKGRTYA